MFAPLARAGVPVVMTLHDFKPWCTNRLLYAHGEICERCRGGKHWNAVAVGCVQGSRVKSAVAAAEAYLHDAWRAYASVRTWIAPSQFVYDKALTFGVERARLRVLSHGVEAAPPSAAAVALPAHLPATRCSRDGCRSRRACGCCRTSRARSRPRRWSCAATVRSARGSTRRRCRT
ncbi:MAG: glycosyltransferase [Candidatus Eisenbacteria bacterium]|nr:glycosyltransferase [Candidatus Eisenbacteria bacterium]